jgi:hypothetical protein
MIELNSTEILCTSFCSRVRRPILCLRAARINGASGVQQRASLSRVVIAFMVLGHRTNPVVFIDPSKKSESEISEDASQVVP